MSNTAIGVEGPRAAQLVKRTSTLLTEQAQRKEDEWVQSVYKLSDAR